MKKYNHSVAAVILAAGSGSRMNSDVTKQRLSILGESVLKRCVRPFILSEYTDRIIVVCRHDELEFAKSELDCFSEKPISFVVGGKTRQESAAIGFFASDNADFVLIHDGARCPVTKDNIDSVVEAAFEYGAATASSSVTDTVKFAEDGFALSTVSRDKLASVQTPQAFESSLYKRALENAEGMTVTDDNMLVEALGVKIKLVDTGKLNIKLTTAEDIALAEYILTKRP